MILGGEARLRAIGPWSLRPSFAKRLRRRNGYFRLARRSRRSWAPWLRSMKEPRVLSPPDARAPAAIPSEAVIRSVEILRPPPGCLYRHLSGPPELLGAGGVPGSRQTFRRPRFGRFLSTRSGCARGAPRFPIGKPPEDARRSPQPDPGRRFLPTTRAPRGLSDLLTRPPHIPPRPVPQRKDA